MVDSSSRRKNIGWCIPIQSVNEPKTECNDDSDEIQNKPDKTGKKNQVEDDGFESLNSNGSSVNGDENHDVQRERRESSNDEGEKRKGERQDTEVVDSTMCNEKDVFINYGVERESGREVHKDSRSHKIAKNTNEYPTLCRKSGT